MLTDSEFSVKSCLTDKPLQSCEDDNLRASDYANALAQFIKNADTPVTIGIQGGWGSGKTSLITVLQEKLHQDEDHSCLCVLVNAWEHSLFQDTDSKAEVALSLLNGLTSGLKKSVMYAEWLGASAKKVIGDQSEKVETAIEGLKLGLMFAGKVAAQMVSNVVGGGDVSNVKVGRSNFSLDNVPPLAENVHNLRSGLEEMIKKLTYQGKPIKIVYFIDDLDRVPPPTAVEILDITKNIFDIPDCVFVLAIDYEVVVKGLEAKFGKKDVSNEREFRQYFDKIIQIPFTMPVGAYGENLTALLRPALQKLGNSVADTDSQTLKNLAEDARLATGGIPRSIKRIINTLSLLQHIANARPRTSQNKSMGLPKDIEARFIIVALHINYPEICRRLVQSPDFPKWNSTNLDLPWKLDIKNNQSELDALGKSKLFDDDWEKVVYCLCTSSDWLKSQASNVSTLLNRLLVVLDDGADDPKALTPEGLQTLQSILDGMKVVSIDSELAVIPEFDNRSVKTDQITVGFSKIQNGLAKHLSGIVPVHTDEYARKSDGRPYEVPLDGDIYDLFMEWYKDDEKIVMSFWSELPCTKRKAKPVIEENLDGFAYEFDGKEYYLYFSMPFTHADFLNNQKLGEVLKKTIALYSAMVKIQQALEEI